MTIFGGRIFNGVKLNELIKIQIQYIWYPYKNRIGHKHTEVRKCDDTGRRQPSKSQGERLH